jgi:hypothetical protein
MTDSLLKGSLDPHSELVDACPHCDHDIRSPVLGVDVHLSEHQYENFPGWIIPRLGKQAKRQQEDDHQDHYIGPANRVLGANPTEANTCQDKDCMPH